MSVRSARRAVTAAMAAAAVAGFSLTPAAAGHPGAAEPRARATAAPHWSEFGFDAAHTGDNPFEHILSPGNVAGLRLKWAAPADGRVDSSAAVAGGVVYFPSNDRLYAVRAATGAKLWSFGFVNAFFSDPAVAGGIVYTGSVNGHVYARDAATGKKVWTFAIPGSPHANYPPTVANGVVYAAANGASNGALAGFVYALDAATGKKLWSSTRLVHVPTGVAAAGGVVYETTSDDDGFGGGAYALDAATGTVLWHVSSTCTVSNPGCVLTNPVVANGILYAGSAAGTDFARLEALKASNGKLLWRTPALGQDIFDWPAVANGLVYIGIIGPESGVQAFNATTGKHVWTFSLSATPGPEAQPTVANGVVYIADGDEAGTLYALDASTGNKLASISVGTPIEVSNAVVVNGAVYIGGFDQRLHAYALP